MNAAEIIQEFNRLPEDEKGKVIEFVRNMSAESPVSNNEAFLKAAEKVFTENAPLFDKLSQ